MCEQARKMEKKLISIPSSPISGTMAYDGESVIFPKEFEEYTYQYLLSVAQGVEQKVFATHFATPPIPGQPSAPMPTSKTAAAEKAVEAELRAFAEAQQVQAEPAPQSEEGPKHAMPAPTMQKQGFNFLSFFPQKKAVPSAPAPPAKVASGIPSTVPQAQSAMPPAPPAVPPAQSAAQITPPPIPAVPKRILPTIPAYQEHGEEGAGIDGETRFLQEQKGTPSPKAKREGLETTGETLPHAEKAAPEGEEEPFEQPEKEAPGRKSVGDLKSFMASSKISPRLRKIIEEKLRKEEATREKAEGPKQVGIEGPQPQEVEAPEEEKEGPEGETEEMEGRAAKEKAMPQKAKPAPKAGRPKAKHGKEEKVPARKKTARLQEEEKEMGGEEEPEEKEEPAPRQSAIQKEQGEPQRRMELVEEPIAPGAPSGGLTIKPIFPGQKQEGKGISPEDEESEKRLARIESIISDLSPSTSPGVKKAEGQVQPAKKPVPAKARAPVQVPAKVSTVAKQPAKAAAPARAPAKAPLPAARQPSRAPAPTAGTAAKLQYKPQEGTENEKPAVASRPPGAAKPRILPGGIIAGQGAPLRTYVPPARKPVLPEGEPETGQLPPRRKPVPKAEEEDVLFSRKKASDIEPRLDAEIPEGDTEAEEGEVPSENKEESSIPGQETAPEEQGEAQAAEETPAEDAAQEGQVPAEEGAEEKKEAPKQANIVSRLKMTRLASAERMVPQKTPEQLSQEARMARMADQLARIELQKPKEVAGKAQMPEEKEEIPTPPVAAKPPEARPEDYGKAKENFKLKMEEDEISQLSKQREEESLEQYAKENVVWLYEIYKMGGVSREEFLQKMREKLAAEKSGADGKPAPPNPAFANLGKAMEKKYKK